MDIVDFCENVLGLKLFESQKIFLRLSTKKQQLYYLPTRGNHLFYTHVLPLVVGMMRLESEKDNESDKS